MRPMNEIKNHSVYESTMKSKLYATFGDNDFSDAMYNVIGDVIDDYISFDYHTWLYEDDEPITNANINRYVSFVHRYILRKYKYFEFFKDRWSLEGGTNYGNKEIKTRTLIRDRELQVNNTRDYNNTHTSSTDMDYTSNASGTDNTDNSIFNMSENAPLGAGETITTPYGKDKSTSSVDNTTSTERTDTQDISVNSGDISKDTLNSKTLDDITDTENETITYENGVEILKAMKYNNMSVMDVMQDIIDRTVYELNVVI
jgi:hypothetical protein